MSAPTLVTQAPSDVPATSIGRQGRIDLSTVVTTLPESRQTPGGTAATVLAALGVQHEANGKARHDYDNTILLPIWLAAHRVQRLIVASPQHVPVASLLALADMCSNTPTSLVLACDNGYAPTMLQQLEPIAPNEIDWVAANTPLTPPTTSTQAGQDHLASDASWRPDEPRRLPDNEFLTFYAVCERLLDNETFAQVDILYRDTLGRILTWLDNIGDGLTVDAAIDVMTELLNEQGTLDDVAVITNAVQAGFFRHGWIFNIDHREMRNALLRHPGPKVTYQTWRRLRAYRDPARSATTALFLAGLTPDAIPDLTVTDLAAWHANPAAPLAGTVIPEQAGPYLRAQLLARTIAGGHPADPLFLGTAKRVLLDLHDAQDDLGINLGDSKILADEPFGNRRTLRHAYQLERIS